jgi:hypothetical protein
MFVWLLQEYCSRKGTGWDGYGNGNGYRLYDADSGRMEADRSLVCWSGRFGLMVWSLKILVWFGLVWFGSLFLVLVLALALAASFFWFSFNSTRRLWDWTGLFLYIYPHAFACSFFQD